MIVSESDKRELSANYGTMSPSQSMPESTYQAMMEYQSVYPEIYYRLQPYIMMVCDQMDYHSVMPSLDTVQQMTDHIYDDVCKMYPDMEEYARNNENDPDAIPVFNHSNNPFRGRFRRRGLFKDVIDILLLSELFRRRRRY